MKWHSKQKLLLKNEKSGSISKSEQLTLLWRNLKISILNGAVVVNPSRPRSKPSTKPWRSQSSRICLAWRADSSLTWLRRRSCPTSQRSLSSVRTKKSALLWSIWHSTSIYRAELRRQLSKGHKIQMIQSNIKYLSETIASTPVLSWHLRLKSVWKAPKLQKPPKPKANRQPLQWVVTTSWANVVHSRSTSVAGSRSKRGWKRWMRLWRSLRVSISLR